MRHSCGNNYVDTILFEKKGMLGRYCQLLHSIVEKSDAQTGLCLLT